MKWLLVVVAFVVGAALTWLLTVKRVTRTVDAAGVEAGTAARLPAAQDDGEDTVDVMDGVGEDDSPDEASRFGGERTEASEDPGPAERWHRDAEDVDALLSPPAATGVGKEGSHGGVQTAPVADAAPSGDVAGVGEPSAVEAVESAVSKESDPPGGEVSGAEPG